MAVITGEQVGAGVLLIVVGSTLWLTRHPIPSINGKVVIVPTNVPSLIRKDDEIDGTVVVTHRPSGDQLTADMFLGNFYWTPEIRDGGTWDVKYRHYRYLIDPGLDIGVFAGYSSVAAGLDTGVRLSPVRLLYGTIAPDALIGRDGAGVGISVYPMPEYFGPFWKHVGVGYGREFSYHGDESGNAFYLALSTRF